LSKKKKNLGQPNRTTVRSGFLKVDDSIFHIAQCFEMQGKMECLKKRLHFGIAEILPTAARSFVWFTTSTA
jgi:hypothetical protein